MKKLIAMLLTALCAVPVSVAEETITGMVVDKKGNPLPGVRIEVPGTSDLAISDLDGTFTLSLSDPSKKKVYATYAGMNPRNVKIKDGMRIKMKEYNWWTKKPDEWNWMVNAILAVPNNPFGDFFNPAYGLMIGRVKKFGYYVKGVTNTFGTDIRSEAFYRGFIDKETSTYWSATGGAMMRLGCPIHLYAGVGFASYSHNMRDLKGEWHQNYDNCYDNFVVDLGFLIRISHVNISLGLCAGFGQDSGYYSDGSAFNTAGNFGIGYSF